MTLMAPEARLVEEVERFRRWASSLTERRAEWETEYPEWTVLRGAVVAFLDSADVPDWVPEATEAVLFAVARDNESEVLADELAARPSVLRFAVRAAIAGSEPDAKWLLGCRLAEVDGPAAAPSLRLLARDADEYVRRRALIELGRLRDPLVEELAETAWATGHEYQRMAALQALADAGSPRLRAFLQLGREDGRPYLAKTVTELQDRSQDS